MPKVLDFGAARPREVIDEAASTGMVIGSPHYMPVEQASGARDLDARVDQYALAVILPGAHAHRPFENDDGHVLAKVLGGAGPSTSSANRPRAPASLEAVLRGIAPRPGRPVRDSSRSSSPSRGHDPEDRTLRHVDPGALLPSR